MSYCPECQTSSQIVSSPDTFDPRCSNCFSVLDFPHATTLEALQNFEKEVFNAVQHKFFNTYGKPSPEQSKFEKRGYFSYLKREGLIDRSLTAVFWGIVLFSFGLIIPLVSQLQNEVFSGHESSVNLVLVLIKATLILTGILVFLTSFGDYRGARERYNQNQEKFEWHEQLVYSHEAYKHLKKIPYLVKGIIPNAESGKFSQHTRLNTGLQLTVIFNLGSLLALLIIGNNFLSDPVATLLAGIAFIGFSISMVRLFPYMFYSYNNDSNSFEDIGIAGSILCTFVGVILLIVSIIVLYHQRFGEIIVSFLR